MNALFISADPGILDAESPVRARMLEYAKAIGTLHILLRAEKTIDLSDGPLSIHAIRVSRVGSIAALTKKAKSLIATCGIAVVSAQDPFEHGLVALRAVRGSSAKLHIQVHTDFLSPWFTRGGMLGSPRVPMPLKNHVRVRIANRVLPHADGIRVVSERVKQSMLSRYGSRIAEPIVLPIAVDATLPPPVPLPAHTFPFALITASRLEPEKRIEDIIEALARIRESYPAVGLFICGEGSERPRLESFAKKRGVSDRVVFLGWRREDYLGLMQSAQGYIQASAYEGYSRSLIEAALARTPIITTDVGIVGEVLVGYEDVLASPPADPAQLAVNIVALLQDTASRVERVMSAEHKAREHLAKYADLPTLIARDLARVTDSSSVA